MTYKYYEWLFEGTEAKSKNIYFLIGPPAVGKSTWIKKNFQGSGKEYKVISRDDIIEKIIYKEYGLTAADVYAKDKSDWAKRAFGKTNYIFDRVVRSVIDSRPDNIIVDMMNATAKQRKDILSIITNNPDLNKIYKKIAVVFEFRGHEDKIIQADKQREKERGGERVAIDPEYILSKMRAIESSPPTKEEGFDEIQHYNRFKEPEQMKEYNHKQFIDWLNNELKEPEIANDKLLIEAILSKYWKKRAARRAKAADRNWPNATDRNWALQQQEKSTSINTTIQDLFQKELEQSEDMVDDIGEVMRNMKKEREKLKLKREAAKMLKPQEKVKKKKSLSKPYPPHKKGETVGGYARKVAKKLGGPTTAPGESFGPLEEEK